jgi:serine/threonine-protein kinase
VTANLISAADSSQLWSGRYNKEMADLFDLQDEIAQAIAAALQVRLSGTSVPSQRYEPNLPAYDALLKARHYYGLFRSELFPRMKECFEQAIALDPKFALAHCEYGMYFVSMTIVGALPANDALPKARDQAQRALDLDPSLPEGNAMLGWVAAFLEYDWKEAEMRFRLAMAHDPVPVFVRLCYAVAYLLLTGRAADAVQQFETALRADPLNLFLRLNRIGQTKPNISINKGPGWAWLSQWHGGKCDRGGRAGPTACFHALARLGGLRGRRQATGLRHVNPPRHRRPSS